MKKLTTVAVAAALMLSAATPVTACPSWPYCPPPAPVFKGSAPAAHAPWFVWLPIICAAGIVGTAVAYSQTRELTQEEALTCGVKAWVR